MNISMVTASNTLNQLQKKVDTLSHNIANMNTAGYKRRNATFQELLTQQFDNQPHPQKELGRVTPDGIRLGYGSMIGQTTVFLGQGSPQQTERPLDFMITGERGWFQVQRTTTDENNQPVTETLYTRNGSFHWQLDPDPQNPDQVRLVTELGDLVLGENGPISIDANYKSFTVSPEGRITVETDNGIIDYGSLQIVRITRPDLLLGMGDSVFRLDAGEANAANYVDPIDLNDEMEKRNGYSIQQGALEMSNVDLSQELTELILTQRLMQFQTRSITIADEMMGLANSIRG